MRRVLLVTYMFPPSGGVGVQRALAYAQYFPQNGYQLSVVTANRSAMPVSDPGLLEAVPEQVRVIRTFNPEPSYELRDRVWKRFSPPHRSSGSSNGTASNGATSAPFATIKAKARSVLQNLLFPDVQTLWVPFATRAAIREVEQGADTVILNVPPFSTLKVAVELRRRYPDLKIIADFRDDWMGYYAHQFDSPDERKLLRSSMLERLAVESCELVSLATESWAQGMQERYPDQDPSKFIVTTNGFDPKQFLDFENSPRVDGKFVITYFGTCHNNRIYSPENYLTALDSLPDEVRESIETRFIGRVTPEAKLLLENRRTGVKTYGFVPKSEGVRLMQEADLLLLIATDRTSHAAKLFDYLGTQKPILALSHPGGEIDRLIRQTGTGVCADSQSVAEIRAAVLRLFELAKSNRPLNSPDAAAISRYSWPVVMGNLAERIAAAQERERKSQAATF